MGYCKIKEQGNMPYTVKGEIKDINNKPTKIFKLSIGKVLIIVTILQVALALKIAFWPARVSFGGMKKCCVEKLELNLDEIKSEEENSKD